MKLVQVTSSSQCDSAFGWQGADIKLMGFVSRIYPDSWLIIATPHKIDICHCYSWVGTPTPLHPAFSQLGSDFAHLALSCSYLNEVGNNAIFG